MADYRQLNATQRDYTAYGLHVRSSVALPFCALPHPSGEPDVHVRFAATRRLRAATIVGATWEAAPGALLLHVDGVARYLVSDGARIAIQPEGGSERDCAAFLSGSVFGACLQQRGIALFRASAVATPAGAALFLGAPGVGKSTLLAALTDRGYAMLADDVAGVASAEDGTLEALPAFPAIGLWPNSLEALGWGDRGGNALREGTEKRYVRSPRFHASPLAVCSVFWLGVGNANVVEKTPCSQREAWEHLETGGYQRNFLFGVGQSARQFRVAAAMANSLTVRAADYDVSGFRPHALAKRVAASLEADAALTSPPRAVAVSGGEGGAR